ncbi:hypothetical protein KKD52_11985, partial [Myxococcota bacterium]|nr:hypothetical protein [Myxococcota bacterium]MBU1511074.1 hypothetical protein [Myxococcota bacterium]
SLLLSLVLALLSACDADTKAVTRCGDDFLDPGEDCDGAIVGITCGVLGHYNVNGALSCRSDCTYNLTDCGGSCGDGVVELNFNEDCDADNLGGATCESLGFRGGTLTCGDACQFDTSQCESTCGNGTLDAWELCDGVLLGGASCLSLGYSGGALACSGDCTYDEQNCQTVCGNAVLETGEACDGNKLRGLTCEALGYESGALSCNPDCTLDRDDCVGTSLCGNGAVDAPETCDGAALGGATCVTLGYEGGVLSCGLDCRLDVSRCVGATCGNGQVDTGEACEPGVAFTTTCRDLDFLGGTLTCSSSCQWNTLGCNNIDLCGNGTADPGEACDGTDMNDRTCVTEGFYTGTATCGADCSVNTSACAGFCGDGTLDDAHGELCDGDLLGGSTCVTEGFYEGTLACDAGCAPDTAGCTGRCGDGAVDAAFGEACDGTDFGGRTCYSGTFACLGNCQINDFNCQGWCGDGVIQSGFEECDGANFDAATPPCGALGFAGGTRTCDLASCTPEYNCLTWVKVKQSDYHGCALDATGQLWCWGNGNNGNLGDGTWVSKTAPVKVLGPAGMGWLNNVVDFSVGRNESCAVRVDGSVWCWGYNYYGQLGDGTTTSSSVPVRVRGPGGSGYLADVVKIFSGVHYQCALKSDETLWCWGNNGTIGCLGTNSLVEYLPYPTQVSGINGVGFLTEVKDVALRKTDCGGKAIIGSSGTLVAWGNMSTQKNPSGGAIAYPVNVKDSNGVSNLTGIVKVSDSFNFACAIKTNGNVICWGNGILGNNQPSGENIYPVLVHNETATGYLEDIVEISVSTLFSICAIKVDGSVYCWGSNDIAQAGIGNNIHPKIIPVPMSGPSGVGLMSDASQIDNFCLVRTNGSAYCWSIDHQGTVGDGTSTFGHATIYYGGSNTDAAVFPVPVLGSAP